jgi:transposase-like protein
MIMTKRKNYSADEKVRLLKEHLVEKVPVSEICQRTGLNPNVFYKWQKQFFENGTAAFAEKSSKRKASPNKQLERQNAQLQAKLAKKDEVIAEIIESHIKLKKNLGQD